MKCGAILLYRLGWDFYILAVIGRWLVTPCSGCVLLWGMQIATETKKSTSIDFQLSSHTRESRPTREGKLPG